MNSTDSWPDKGHPGFPEYPEFMGNHRLLPKIGGRLAEIGKWFNIERRWIIGGEFYTPDQAAYTFDYIECEEVILSPQELAAAMGVEEAPGKTVPAPDYLEAAWKN